MFLNDAPAPREFWARRQCHETTMHAVDALSAALGRHPDPSEAWIETDLAVDGIDELLAGFLTRPRSQLRCEEPGVLVVAPDDAPDWWQVELESRPGGHHPEGRSARGRRLGPRRHGGRPLPLAVEPHVARGPRGHLAGAGRGHLVLTRLDGSVFNVEHSGIQT